MFNPKKFLSLALTALIAVLLIPAAAQAAGSVAVAVGSTDIQAPTNGTIVQDYTYNLTFDSVPDHATVDIIAPDGTKSIPTITRDLHSAQSPVAGSGTFIIGSTTPAGYYTVKVAYFSAGSAQWEARASKVFRVIAPKPSVVIPEPTPPVTTPEPTPPVTTPTPAPPVTTPTATPEVTTPAPTPTVVIPPQATQENTKIHLTKTVARKTVKPGKAAPFTLTVKNTGTATAIAVKVCDTIPAHTTVSNLGGGKLSNGKVCWSVGNLTVGKSAVRKLTLRVDSGVKVRSITNHATATAANATTVKAQATIKVPKVKTPTVTAPVTG